MYWQQSVTISTETFKLNLSISISEESLINCDMIDTYDLFTAFLVLIDCSRLKTFAHLNDFIYTNFLIYLSKNTSVETFSYVSS